MQQRHESRTWTTSGARKVLLLRAGHPPQVARQIHPLRPEQRGELCERPKPEDTHPRLRCLRSVLGWPLCPLLLGRNSGHKKGGLGDKDSTRNPARICSLKAVARKRRRVKAPPARAPRMCNHADDAAAPWDPWRHARRRVPAVAVWMPVAASCPANVPRRPLQTLEPVTQGPPAAPDQLRSCADAGPPCSGQTARISHANTRGYIPVIVAVVALAPAQRREARETNRRGRNSRRLQG